MKNGDKVQNHMAHIGPQLTEHAKTISLLKSDLDRVFRDFGIYLFHLLFTLLITFQQKSIFITNLIINPKKVAYDKWKPKLAKSTPMS